jgi:hypothetical protein
MDWFATGIRGTVTRDSEKRCGAKAIKMERHNLAQLHSSVIKL